MRRRESCYPPNGFCFSQCRILAHLRSLITTQTYPVLGNRATPFSLKRILACNPLILMPAIIA